MAVGREHQWQSGDAIQIAGMQNLYLGYYIELGNGIKRSWKVQGSLSRLGKEKSGCMVNKQFTERHHGITGSLRTMGVT